jgi:hypothetical protein
MAENIDITVSNTPVEVTVNTVPIVVIPKQIYSGHGAPSEIPVNPSIEALYFDLDTYQTYFWNPETQSW